MKKSRKKKLSKTQERKRKAELHKLMNEIKHEQKLDRHGLGVEPKTKWSNKEVYGFYNPKNAK